MIREIVRPKDDNLTIKIPKEYIGKDIEYIIFPIKNQKNVKEKFDIALLGGALKKYANPKKIELEKNAWELHIMDKFSKWLF